MGQCQVVLLLSGLPWIPAHFLASCMAPPKPRHLSQPHLLAISLIVLRGECNRCGALCDLWTYFSPRLLQPTFAKKKSDCFFLKCKFHSPINSLHEIGHFSLEAVLVAWMHMRDTNENKINVYLDCNDYLNYGRPMLTDRIRSVLLIFWLCCFDWFRAISTFVGKD